MPELPIKEATIDGVTYKVKLLGGRVAFEAMSRAAAALANKISPEDFDWLREQFAATTNVGIVDAAGDGQTRFVPLASVFDEHFRGGPQVRARMLQWFHFAIEANFGPFSDVLRALTGFLRARSSSISPTTAPGSSGDSSPPPA